MMERNSFSVLFFLKKTKLLKNGEASVCMRITVNNVRAETNIRKSINPSLWNQAKECSRGKDRKSNDLNKFIDEARIKLYNIHEDLKQEGLPISAIILRDKFFGLEEKEAPRMVITTIQEHNDQCRQLVGKDFALITVRRYESCKRYLAELIKIKFEKEDIPLKDVNGEFIRAFEFYLKTEKDCAQNTVIRYMKCLKKITNRSLANEWINKDPFAGIKFHEKEVHREFLTWDELQILVNKKFEIPRIDLVRDIFVFCAYSGLSFIDVKQLSSEHITKDREGNYWIRKARQKTKNMCNIPLLDVPLSIIEKYKNHPLCKKQNVLLPVPCNQKMNAYIKEISDLCGIKKNLSTHCARYTYATSVCLANGVSMENVAKMLGHSNISMTKRYAKVLDQSILNDMQKVGSLSGTTV